jgi:hypothetical protein
MKKVAILLTATIGLTAYKANSQPKNVSQDRTTPVTVVTSEDMFKAGVWNFDLNQMTKLEFGSNKQDGNKTGNYSEYGVRLDVNYFVINHFGVGAGINFSGNKTENTTVDPSTTDKSNDFGGHINFLYGTRFGDKVNFLTEASIGLGKETQKSDYGYGETTTKDKLFNFRWTAGVPLQIQRNIFITPKIGLDYRHLADSYTEKRFGFLGGVDMDFFMGCGDDESDCGPNAIPFGERYRQGNILLGSRMKGYFKTGGLTQTYTGEGSTETKDKFGMSHLSGYALYNVIDNFSVGAGIDFGMDHTSSKDTDYKTNQTDFLFYPIVRYHIPVDNPLRNLYGEGNFGVGLSNTKLETGGNTTKDKYSLTSWGVNLGYDYNLAKRFAISPYLGYGGEVSKSKSTDIKTSYAGLMAGIGFDYNLRY